MTRIDVIQAKSAVIIHGAETVLLTNQVKYKI